MFPYGCTLRNAAKNLFVYQWVHVVHDRVICVPRIYAYLFIYLTQSAKDHRNHLCRVWEVNDGRSDSCTQHARSIAIFIDKKTNETGYNYYNV